MWRCCRLVWISLPLTISPSLDANSNNAPLEPSVTTSMACITSSKGLPSSSASEGSGLASPTRTQNLSSTQTSQGQANTKKQPLPTFLTWSSPWTRTTPSDTGPRYCGTPRLDDFEWAYLGHPGPKWTLSEKETFTLMFIVASIDIPSLFNFILSL